MNFSKQHHSPPGFTLVEVMIAMVIAMIVMGGVYQTLVNEDVNHDRSEKILDMQNNARVALVNIVKDVRRAGFLGCGGELAANTLVNQGTDDTMIGKLTIAKAPAGLPRNMDPVTGYPTILKQLIGYPTMTGYAVGVDYLGEALGFADNAPADHDYYQEGSDALTLVFLSSEVAVAAPGMASNSVPIPLVAEGFEKGDVICVTDCQEYSLLQKTDVRDSRVRHVIDAPSLNTTTVLKNEYGAKAQARVYKLNTSTYFLSKGNYTLCHDNPDQAVAVNIEDLQFEFLFDENLDDSLTDDLANLSGTSGWQANLGTHTSKEVRAVRIWLLAMSEPDYTYSDTNTYDYPNSPYAATSPAAQAPITSPADGEHRHRYLASAVVYLRNAGLQ